MSSLSSAAVPAASKMKVEIARLLKECNFITGYKTLETPEGKKILRVALKYAGATPVIRELKRVSSPGLRQYVGAAEIPRVLLSGNAAVAEIHIAREGQPIYTDFISPYRFPEGWRMVAKVFHTHPTS